MLSRPWTQGWLLHLHFLPLDNMKNVQNMRILITHLFPMMSFPVSFRSRAQLSIISQFPETSLKRVCPLTPQPNLTCCFHQTHAEHKVWSEPGLRRSTLQRLDLNRCVPNKIKYFRGWAEKHLYTLSTTSLKYIGLMWYPVRIFFIWFIHSFLWVHLKAPWGVFESNPSATAKYRRL